MKKSNIFTDAVESFFDFISTGYGAVDRFIQRGVKVAVLLAVVIAAVSSLGQDVYVGSQTVANVFSLGSDAVDEVVTAGQADPDVQAAMKFLEDAQKSLLGDDVVVERTEVVDDIPVAMEVPSDPPPSK